MIHIDGQRHESFQGQRVNIVGPGTSFIQLYFEEFRATCAPYTYWTQQNYHTLGANHKYQNIVRKE